jgi:hypothetical protein
MFFELMANKIEKDTSLINYIISTKVFDEAQKVATIVLDWA